MLDVRSSRIPSVAAALLLGSMLPTRVHAQPVPPVRLSVSTAGVQGDGHSLFVAISDDDRTVLFESTASTLVAGDTNGTWDLFVRDRDTDRDGVLDEPDAVRTIRVTQGPAGEQLTPLTFFGDPRVSRDGRFVSFSTMAALVATDTNGLEDGYLYDRDADADGILDEPDASGLSLVTTGSGSTLLIGAEVGATSRPLDVSGDGRYVLFWSTATNLSSAAAGTTQCYRKDRLTSVTLLVSSTPDGTPLNTGVCRMSPNGRYVVLATGLPPTQPAGTPWMLRDLDTDAFVSIPVPGSPPSSAPSHAALIAPFFGIGAGFSPDGAQVYLERGTISTGFSAAFRYGSTLEYDLASGRVTREFPGLLNDARPFRDGRTFDLTGYSSFTPQYDTDVMRYDRTTGRITQLVAGQICGFSATATRVLYNVGVCIGATGPMLLDTRYGTPLPMADPIVTGTLSASGTGVLFTSEAATILPGGADTNGLADVFAADLDSRFDRDADGLDDRWEVAMGLSYASNAGDDGPAGDPDGDGQTNLQEQTAGSHPRGTARQFLAEGADNAFFKTRLAIANPGTVAATAVVRLDGDDGSSTRVNLYVPAGARRTVLVDEIGGRAPSFSSTVESSVPLVSERTMTWDATEYGAHAERASNTPATRWFLAEGATGAFSLFYLLQNPGETAATATIRYLRPAPLAPIDRTYPLPPHSRTTLPVEQQAPELASTDVSAAITSTQPILVERAMYRSVPGQPFAAGDDSAGVTSDSTTWFLAEGATGPFFDLFVLLANPNQTDANVEIRYLLSDGTVLTKTYVVAAQSRRTIYVDQESIPGHGQPFVNVAVSCAITSTNGVPIVAERTMWFPGPEVTPNFWTEANNSPGATAAARRWVLADGQAGGSKATQTYVLIANTSSTAGKARLTVLPDQATTIPPSGFSPLPITMTVDLPPNSRTTVPMHTTQGLAGTTFGVLVESIETTPLADLVVERAMYWNSGGVTWAAGTNLLATPIP